MLTLDRSFQFHLVYVKSAWEKEEEKKGMSGFVFPATHFKKSEPPTKRNQLQFTRPFLSFPPEVKKQ
jgi:hypothetical protein